MNLEVFLILQKITDPVAYEFEAPERLINLCKSLENPLKFDLFCKYCCVYFEPQMKNDTSIDLQCRGLIMNATSMHEWSDYIPAPVKSSPREEFTVFGENTVKILLKISDIAVDYTPCVTNTSILSIYKNLKYKIDPDGEEAEDSDDDDSGTKFYKTNTRLVTILGQTTVKLSLSPKKLDMQVKLLEISNYLLYTRDFSHKWSCDVLLDEDHMINSGNSSILSKMGFVDVIRVDRIHVGVSKKVLLEGIPLKNKLRTLASFPDIPDSENLEFPTMMMNSSFNVGGVTEVKIKISEIFITLCQDSILGLLLLAQSAGVHSSKAMKRISRKREEPSSTIKKAGDLFGSVIEEEDEEEDMSQKVRQSFGSLIEEKKFSENYLDECLERKEAEFIIRDSFDIVDPIEPKRINFEEGERKIFHKYRIIDNYLDRNKESKLINFDILDFEEQSKWHSITMPKTEISSGIYTEEKTIPKLRFSLKIKTFEVRVYEGHDF